MADRSVVVRLRAEVGQFKASMDEAAKSTKKVGDEAEGVAPKAQKTFQDSVNWVDQNSAALNGMALRVGAVGVALTAMAALSVASFADFDQAMSNVAATGDDARQNIVALRDAAVKAGADTQYSATQAAGAEEELAKAGLSASQILGGALAGSLNLAAAGSLDVADAAGYMATALAQYHLSGTQATHVSDLLAAGAGKAMGSVDDLGMALKQGGLVASQTGLSIDETTAALAAFAQQGLIGSDAGTSLKTMLQRLTPQSDEAQKAFDDLGISAYDASGNFVGLSNFAGQLQDKMKGLTPEARNAALSVMFGSDAVRGASVLYSEGAAGIEKWTAAVDDQGYAAEVAATKMDNLKGDVEKLSGSFDTMLIQSGSGANDVLRFMVQTLESLVDTVGRVPAPILGILTVLVGAGGLVALGSAGFIKLVTSAAEFEVALVKAGIATEATSAKVTSMGIKGAKSLGKIVSAAALVGAAMSAAPEGVSEGTNEMLANIDRLSAGASSMETIFASISDSFANGSKWDTKTLIGRLGDQQWWDSAAQGTERFLSGITGIFGLDTRSAVDKQIDALSAYGDQLGQLAAQDLPTASKAFKELYLEAGGTNHAGTTLLNQMPGLRDSLIGLANDAGLATDDATLLGIALGTIVPSSSQAATGVDGTSESVSQVEDRAKAAADALDALKKALDDLNQPALDVSNTEIAFQQAVDDATAAVEKNGQTLDLNTDKGRANQTALNDMAKAASDRADAVLMQTGSEDAFRQSLDGSRQMLYDTAVQFGMSEGAAHTYVDQVLQIPPSATTQVILDKSAAQDALDGWITDNSGRQLPVSLMVKLGQIVPGISSSSLLAAAAAQQADGSVLSFYGSGGVENHVAQMAPAGAMRVWAEPETGGESYIPHAPSKRSRSLAIWAQTGKVLGVSGFADGAYAGRSVASPTWGAAAPSSTTSAPGQTFMVTQEITTSDPLAAGIAGVRYMQSLGV